MIKFAVYIILFIASIFPVSHYTTAQTLSFRPGQDSYITVTGTSTLHDWEMKSEIISSEVVFNTNDSGSPESLESVMLKLNKNTLKSDKSGLERRAYDAMKANRHPEIVFRANGSGSLQNSGDRYQVSTNGELTIAGVTRQISVTATCINGDDERLVCSGSTRLKMSDFNIDPPVMMLGALRTSDEITISYKINYAQ